MIRVLGSDPGERTYASAVVDFKVGRGDKLTGAKVIHVGYNQHTIRNLSSVPRKEGKGKKRRIVPNREESLALFSDEYMGLLLTYNPVTAVAERFQTRGIQGRTIETVSVMNGAAMTLAMAHGVGFRNPIAAEWKNFVKIQVPLEDLYEIAKVAGIQPHPIDAVLMTVYDRCKELGTTVSKAFYVKLVKEAVKYMQKHPTKPTIH